MNASTKKEQAYHEAGHAVVGVLSGRKISSIEIQIGGESRGCVTWADNVLLEGQATTEQIRPICLTLMAGYESQILFCGDTFNSAASWRDDAEITKQCDRVPAQISAQLRESFQTELRNSILKRPDVRAAIVAVAEKLLETSKLNGEQATILIRENLNLD